MRYSLAPLGKDRYYRRYWVFKSLPGLFVEDDDQFVEQLVGSIQIKNEINDKNIFCANNKNSTSTFTSSNISSKESIHTINASKISCTGTNVANPASSIFKSIFTLFF